MCFFFFFLFLTWLCIFRAAVTTPGWRGVTRAQRVGSAGTGGGGGVSSSDSRMVGVAALWLRSLWWRGVADFVLRVKGETVGGSRWGQRVSSGWLERSKRRALRPDVVAARRRITSICGHGDSELRVNMEYYVLRVHIENSFAVVMEYRGSMAAGRLPSLSMSWHLFAWARLVMPSWEQCDEQAS